VFAEVGTKRKTLYSAAWVQNTFGRYELSSLHSMILAKAWQLKSTSWITLARMPIKANASAPEIVTCSASLLYSEVVLNVERKSEDRHRMRLNGRQTNNHRDNCYLYRSSPGDTVCTPQLGTRVSSPISKDRSPEAALFQPFVSKQPLGREYMYIDCFRGYNCAPPRCQHTYNF